MALVSGAPPRSVVHQVLRGVGFTLAASFWLLLALWLAGGLLTSEDAFVEAAVPPARRAASVAVVVALAVAVLLVRRWLRRWEDRPHWLMPAAWLVLLGALIPAVAIPTARDDFGSRVCVPLADAWRPVLTASASDLAYWRSVYAAAPPPLTHDHAQNRAQLQGYLAAQSAKRAAPAFVRADNYVLWASAGGSCAPRSRTALGWSAAGFGLGAGGIAFAVRRRRVT